MALKGALDAEYRMIKDNKNGVIRVDATKMKDAEKPETVTFELRTVGLGLKDKSGHEVTSAVLHSIDYENMPKDKYLSPQMEKAITLLRELYAKHEKNLVKSGRKGAPPSVSKNNFWDACKKEEIYSRRDSFNRALGGLAERNYTTCDDNNVFVYPTEIYNKYHNPNNQV
jgi:hypothetical protein